MRFFIVFFFLSVIISNLCLAQKKNLILDCSFENKDDLSIWFQEQGQSKAIHLNNTVARRGKHSVRFELNKSDPIVANGKRAELVFKTNSTLKLERWYGFSNYLPGDYEEDTDPDIVAQWHEIPDFKVGETWRVPPIALRIQNGKWMLNIQWAKLQVNTQETISGKEMFDFGHCVTSKWADWVFHIKFSWEEDGLLEVWRNGKLLLSRRGPNCYNDEFAPYFKIGIYKWGWVPQKVNPTSTTSKRVIFYDEVRIGDSAANKIDVTPRRR